MLLMLKNDKQMSSPQFLSWLWQKFQQKLPYFIAFGVFFLAFIFMIINEKATGLILAGVGLLTLPTVWTWLMQQLRWQVAPPLKKIILVVLFFVALTLTSNELAPTPEKAVSNLDQESAPSLEASSSAPVASSSANPSPITVSEEATTSAPTTIKVARIVDGDTIELENGQKVRYIGIDTPEIHGTSECYGQEAAAKNSALVLGKSVILEKDISDTDRYGRLLRYVYVDGLLVNEILVREGYAHASSYPPDVKYQTQLQAAATLAQQEHKGLWGAACNSAATVATPASPTTTIPVTTLVAAPASPPVTNPTPAAVPVSNNNASSGNYTCNCSKTCKQMSCAEAQYQLHTCGCTARDGDDDGTACDSQCQ